MYAVTLLSMSRRSTMLLAAAAALLTCASPAEAVREHGTSRGDVLIGSHQRDVLDGRAGNDEIMGLRGTDTLVGGRGNDTITAEGNDRVSAGSGNDRIVVERPRAGLRVRCGPGRDRVSVDQTGVRQPLGKASVLRRLRGCETITFTLGTAPAVDPGGVAPPPAANAGVAAPAHPDLASTTKLFGITHATGGGAAGLRALRGIGVQADRVEFRPQMAWSEIDERYRLALSEGIRVLPVLNELSRISSLDPGAFSAWVAAFAARYGAGGSFWATRSDGAMAIPQIELFNEPYGAWYYTPVEPAAFAHLYVAAVDAGRRANPNTKWLLPMQPTIDENGTSRSWTAELWSAEPQISARVDGLAVHAYGSWTPGANPLWSYWKTRLLYDEWAGRGAARPVWITEAGQCTSAAAPNCVSEAEQAAAVKFYVADVRATSYIKALFVFTHREAGGDPTNRENWFGIVRSDLSPKPAFWAYRDALAGG